MNGVIFVETLRRHWRGMVMWAASVGIMAVYVTMAVPDSKTLKQYSDLMKSIPKLVMLVAGGDMEFLATPAGFLAYAFFSWIMLIMATYAVVVGLNITSAEEDRGTMDILLSLPVPRWRIIAEKFLAYTVAIIVILLVGWLSLVAMTINSTLFNTTPGQLFIATFNMLPSTLLVMAFTAFIATIVRRRGTATAMAATFVAGSYFIDVIARSASVGGIFPQLSFFTYYNANEVMRTGLIVGNVMVLLIATVILFGGSLYAWERRDVGV